MSKVVVVDGVQKYFSAFQLSYQNKTCSECQQDVRKIERQTDGQTERQTFQLSYQNKMWCLKYVPRATLSSLHLQTNNSF